MSEKPYNADDPAFLFSRSLNEDLSEAERRRLEEGLASSAGLRAEADELAAVDGLIKRWGAAKVELDWEPHAALIQEQAIGQDDGLGRIDALLGRWRGKQVDLDWERFTDEVIARVEVEGRPALWRRPLFHFAAPLAAAAAIVLAVNSGFWWSPPVEPAHPVSVVVIGPQVSPNHGIGGPAGQGRVQVSFARAPAGSVEELPRQPRISFVSVGSTTPADWVAESAPL